MQRTREPDTTITLFTNVALIIKSRMQRAVPLPFAQHQALCFVSDHEKPGMQDVAEYLKIAAPSATFLIEELVHGGYLSRMSDAKDRRKVQLALTRKGVRASKLIAQKRARVLGGMVRSLKEADRKQLDRILKLIIQNA